MSSRPTDSVHMAFSFRLALLYTAFLTLSFVVLISVTYQLVNRLVQTRDRDLIEAQALQFKALFSQGGVSAIENYFSQQINPADRVFVRIVDHWNQVRFITASHPLWALLDEKVQKHHLATNESRWNELAREESEGSWIVGSIPLDAGYYLQVGRSNTESRLVLAHFRRMSLRILLPALLLSLLGGWLAARSALAPLRALVQTIRTILETGDLRQRVPSHAQRGELGALSTMFNRILDKNEMLVQGSKDTLDNVAHDLRTPMTHLRNSAERALQPPQPDPRIQREALADCMEESERILQMLNLLMDLAEAQTGGMELHLETITLRELADEVIELYSIVAEDRGIALKNEVPTYLTVQADRMRLRQSIGNLVDNALKYSPEQSEVALLGSSNETTVALAVRDHGCGIAEEDLPRIWDRLYRAERSRATPGLGLGLSMVWAIVEAHGGTLDVQSLAGEGSTFRIHLPRKKN
ncbi:HAMP domain-containing sensor histidine kinase [Pontiella sulfatireligans]|uniref:histidine kinase n=1 Tax=Pontiella sulfatireligans TaxID=2750658 RepID=A0A6C2ULK7_9BACT|nr:HAMP domain-containing sensor histidine kinase [Pontiella sulfatireligans]VGO20221.1 Alkaline phosphatase synthesis sensor protein PhoR [Pontiella sulfatireligans]